MPVTRLRTWVLSHHEGLATWLVYLATFLLLVYPYRDYDWGTHLKYGEYVLTTGKILRQDVFSWTMPGYPWANHAWGYDPLLYSLYSLAGFPALIITGALMAFAIFFSSLYRFRLPAWQLAILALFFVKIPQTVFEQGLRSQTVGLLFLALLIYLIHKSQLYPKAMVVIPAVLWLWANFHGYFLIGLVVMIGYLGVRLAIWAFVPKTPVPRAWLAVLLTSFLVTLANPFTFRVYTEAFAHVSNPWVKEVFEWLPLYWADCTTCNLGYFIGFSVIFMTLIVFFAQTADLPFIALVGIFALMALTQRRYTGPFIVLALPTVAQLLHRLNRSWPRYSIASVVTVISAVIASEFVLFSRLPTLKIFTYSIADYCNYSSLCSPQLATYLLSHPPQGRGLNFYDWGGFFIGQGVKTQLFIDGRMHLWERDGYMPFADYERMYYWEDYDLFRAYTFDWLIVRNDSPLAKKLRASPQDLGNWSLEFGDDTASYYVKR